MSSYTTELRTIIEQATQYEVGLSTNEKIKRGRLKLFDFDYPIFDEAYRETFETHFIKHFYMREIGFETEGLFKFRLETWLQIHMPYFNQLFESELIKFDPLTNTSVETTHKQTNNETETESNTTDNQFDSTTNNTITTDDNTSQSQNDVQSQTGSNTETSNSFGRNIRSDTPDSRLNLSSDDGSGVIEYASNIDENLDKGNVSGTSQADSTRDTISTTNRDTSSTGNQTIASDSQTIEQKQRQMDALEDYINKKVGKIGGASYSQLLNEYRSTFIRIEREIFKEMNELFMLVY